MRLSPALMLLGRLSLMVLSAGTSDGDCPTPCEAGSLGSGPAPSLAEPSSGRMPGEPEKTTPRQPVVGSGAASSRDGSTQQEHGNAHFQRHIRHLTGYGRFNLDTHACVEIQFKACQNPSDCDGCLGLYTCKPALGKCDFKALSRRTGGFNQSLQST